MHTDVSIATFWHLISNVETVTNTLCIHSEKAHEITSRELEGGIACGERLPYRQVDQNNLYEITHTGDHVNEIPDEDVGLWEMVWRFLVSLSLALSLCVCMYLLCCT